MDRDQSRPVSQRGPLPLAVAMALALLVVAGAGACSDQTLRSGDPAEPGHPVEPAGPDTIFPVLGGGLEFNRVDNEFTPVVPLDGLSVGRRDGGVVRDVVSVSLVDPAKERSTDAVSPQVTSETIRIGSRDVTLSLASSHGVTPLADTYEWEEGGARVSVSGGAMAPSVILALSVTSGTDGPRLSVADLPDGLETLGTLAPVRPEYRRGEGAFTTVFDLVGQDEETLVKVDDTPAFIGGWDYDVVAVNGVDGYRTTFGQLLMLHWPVVGSDHWGHITAYGLEADEIVRIAAGITLTDRAGWEARHPTLAADLDRVIPSSTTTAAPATSVTAGNGSPTPT